MRSPLSGPIATLLMFVPLVAIPLFAVFGMPQFSTLAPAAHAEDLRFAPDKDKPSPKASQESDLIGGVQVTESGTAPPPTEGGGGTISLAGRVPREPPPLPEIEGGGATTFGTPSVGAEEDEIERVLVPPGTPVDGGGATTFGPGAEPIPLRVPGESPAGADTVGGGGTTFAARDVPLLPVGPFE